MLQTFSEVKSIQSEILHDIRTNKCSINCAAAISDEGSCHCRCYGKNHGGLWIDIVVVSYESERVS